jgi:hypothetical protein
MERLNHSEGQCMDLLANETAFCSDCNTYSYCSFHKMVRSLINEVKALGGFLAPVTDGD